MMKFFVPCWWLAIIGFSQSVFADFSFTTSPPSKINDTWATGYDSLILGGIATNVESFHTCRWNINSSVGTIFSGTTCRDTNAPPSFVRQWNCSYDTSTKVLTSNLHFMPLDTTLAITLACQTDVSQTIMVLNQNCTTTIDGVTTTCTYGCTAQLSCPATQYDPGNFSAVCQENAQFDNSVMNSCTKATTTPSTSGTSDAPATTASSTPETSDASATTTTPHVIGSTPTSATGTTTTTPKVTPACCDGGQIAGIVIGVLLGIILILGIIFWLWKKDKKEVSNGNSVRYATPNGNTTNPQDSPKNTS